MSSLMSISFVIFCIASIVMILASLLSKKALTDREKSSPFECGFDPMNSSRLPFSIRFFLIAIIFLIFDVEIALILPMIMVIKFSNMIMWSMTSLIFIFILLVGLYHEWNQGALNWSS
uniref:NADH dehydrogenase subunit 3 n=1 Tax=Boreoheptagyia kurobebrevis TaxID=2851578 RepID=UPI002027BEDA|nr:NADH dehydrogenase subunit 3 [Boreoheptagyia kurobebrevis]UQJ73466.1 NADH dehydrogenase subunit 3 [Boreoheptagyia kurobebrevis]